jgi:hypothetical protein
MADASSAVTTALPLLGVGVGAILQYVFSRSAEVRKQAYSLRQQAYVDYLRALAQAGHAKGAEDLAKAQLLAADAKTRIVVYGDRAVLEALASFEEAGPSLTNPRSTQCFLQLALTMRAKADVDVERLRTVLVGPKGPSAVTSAGAGAPNVVESALPGTSVPQ